MFNSVLRLYIALDANTFCFKIITINQQWREELKIITSKV